MNESTWRARKIMHINNVIHCYKCNFRLAIKMQKDTSQRIIVYKHDLFLFNTLFGHLLCFVTFSRVEQTFKHSKFRCFRLSLEKSS